SPPGLTANVTSVRDVGPFLMVTARTRAGVVTLRSQEQVERGDEISIRPGRYAVFDARTGRAVFHSNP
ncbi:MAG: hypothetical protein PVG83_02660, partial [Acidimicrobiia bacterium]